MVGERSQPLNPKCRNLIQHTPDKQILSELSQTCKATAKQCSTESKLIYMI